MFLKEHWKTIRRFVLVSLPIALLEASTLVIWIEIARFSEVLAFFVNTFLITQVQFVIHLRYTWREVNQTNASSKTTRQLIEFNLNRFWIVALNQVLFWIIAGWYEMYYLIVFVLVSGVSALVSFFVDRLIFDRHRTTRVVSTLVDQS